MSGLQAWIIEPIDPVLFGDGRPFTAVPGSRASSLPLPPPSTLAGGVRTRHGEDERGHFDTRRIAEVLRLRSLGPLPVLLDGEGQVSDWLLPAPADAVEMKPPEGGERREIRALAPLAIPAAGLVPRESLAPVGMPRPDRRKPYKQARPLWRWREELKPWLIAAADRPVGRGGWGVEAPSSEPRVHVSLDPATGTAREGALFGVEGRAWQSRERRMALGLMTDAALRPGIGQLGGERRFVRWAPSEAAFPECPAAVIHGARQQRAVRLVLATPAWFEGGDMPRWLLEHEAVRAVVAKAHGRCQVISGWDMAAGRPKPTRRLVPAGAVFYLELSGDADLNEAWARQIWASPISDSEETRRDGFGIALLGTWSGALTPIELGSVK